MFLFSSFSFFFSFSMSISTTRMGVLKRVNRENNKLPFAWAPANMCTSNHRCRIYSVPLTGADWMSAGIQPTSPAQPKVTQQRYGFLMQCPFVASELPALYSPHIDFLRWGERGFEKPDKENSIDSSCKGQSYKYFRPIGLLY